MNMLKQLNEAVRYIEANLCKEIDLDEMARIAGISKDSFMRFFSYMTGMTITEYVRRRKLTLAAYDLQQNNDRVIDIAIRYGYESADAFTRAFSRQHGITPNQARKHKGALKVYPPASFHIVIKGAKEMDFKIVETKGMKLKGVSKKFIGEAANRFEQEHLMWADQHDAAYKKVCNEIPGVWYGIWDDGRYTIAKLSEEVSDANLAETEILAGTYAVFKSGCGGFAGTEIPKLRELIFDSWLQDSNYVQVGDYEVEVYHLYPKNEKEKRYYELWISVELKK